MRIKLTEEQLKTLLEEGRKKKKKKKKDTTLCARGKNAAKAKYDVYPSAYANGYAVQVCKGKIAGLDGKKRCSGKYCSGKKNESVTYTKEQIIENVKKKSQEAFDLENVEVVDRIDEDLAVWFGTKKKSKKGKKSKQPQGPWVNICRKKKGGGHPACGRSDADKGGYPVCRAKSVAANMSQSAKDSACRRKRDKETNVMLSEGLQYHIENQISLSENIYRYGSEEYFNLINEVRSLYKEGKIDLSSLDEELVNQEIGQKGLYEGEDVWLDIPMEEIEVLTEAKFRGKNVKTSSPQRSSSGGKAYKVYVSGCSAKTKSNPSGVKQIRFGSGGLKAKLNNPEAKKSYNARHGCSKGRHNDKCKAGYWSCRLPRYAKKLGLSGGGTWW
jgi:hypothetical protein